MPMRTRCSPALPLYGVPFAAKDNIDIAGLPTTAACPAYAFEPTQDATVIARLVAAGAVWMGKTNLDQFATGLVGARSPYGRPSSSFAADRISGGSSSGSAVVVSRGDVAFSLGTDTAGSGRVPAGFNQLVGLKPTPGRVSTHGVLPACRSLDCVSVFALTVADAARVLAVIEGPDAADAYSQFHPGPARWAGRLRVGVPALPVFSGDAGYAPAFEQAVGRLRALGHEPVAIDFQPLLAVAELLYGGPWVAERHAVVQALLERNPAALDPTVRRVIEAAGRFSATDAFRGQYQLRAAQREAEALWDRVDLLMVPTAPGHPRHTEIDADPIGANAQLGLYTNFVNLLGWSALALPSGTTASGLPFGVTFIAPGAADAALADFGLAWEARTRLRWARRADRIPHRQSTTRGPVRRHAADRRGRRPPVGPAAERQLLERGALLREATHTAPHYRLYALPGTVPPKPGLQRVAGGGGAIAVEVWEMPIEQIGSFLALIPAPLGLGSLELADGRRVHGFLCEGHALEGARDITALGGWRAYLASLSAAPA